MDTSYSHVLQAETARTAQPGVLLRSVHTIYKEQFWRWFSIMAPTSLLGGLILVLVDWRVKEMFRSVPPGVFLFHLADFAGAIALRLGGFFLTWLLGCFALAAVATAVNHLAEDDGDSWRHDSYECARQHIGALFLTALITFVALLLGLSAMNFVELTSHRVVGFTRVLRFSFVISIGSYVIVASMVSWWGVSVPLILQGHLRVWAALKKSVELSNGYEGALFLLVVESVAGSLTVWYAVMHGFPILLPPTLTHSVWYGWLLNAVGVLASAAVEPPLFIGLSMLANPERLNESSLLDAELTT